MEKQAVRWNIKVSKETDGILRAFFSSRGVRKGDLSKFVEDAVRWRVFSTSIHEIKGKNVGVNVDELQELIDKTLGEVREERRKTEFAGRQ